MSTPETPRRSRFMVVVLILLRIIFYGLAAVALTAPLESNLGVVVACVGAIAGVIGGSWLGASRLRLAIVLPALAALLGVVLWLTDWAADSTWVPRLLGPAQALDAFTVVRYSVLSLVGVTLLRAVAARWPTWQIVELLVVTAAVAAIFASHRHGMLGRPLWLTDWAWQRGSDPADILIAVGVGAVAMAALLLLLESARRIRVGAIFALGVLVLFLWTLVDWRDLQEPDDPDNLGLTNDDEDAGEAQSDANPDAGETGQASNLGPDGEPLDGGQANLGDGVAIRPLYDGGGQGDGQRWWQAGLDAGGEGGQGQSAQNDGGQQDGGQRPPDPNFNPPSGQTNASPMAVVLLGDDYEPPAEMFYFRQDAWSQYNGNRLVTATQLGADRDIADYFALTPTDVGDPPPQNGRAPVVTTVALLVDHPRPFGLESPLRYTPLANPDPERFIRSYQVDSLVQTIDYVSLAEMPLGNVAWTEDLRAHYLEAPEDARYAALAEEIVQGLRPDLRQHPFARILAVKQWLDHNTTYATQHRHADALDATADFLFGDRIGYCVHLAHAAVYLMRILGVPARVGVGYAVPADARTGSTILIQSGDAHAWPEIYFEGIGWIIIDISPENTLDPPPPPADPQLQQMLGEMARGTPPDPSDLLGELGDDSEPIEWMKILRQVLLWGLVTLYGIKVWRRFAPRFADPHELPRVGYRLALDWLSEMGHSRHYGETREAFAQRVSALLPAFTTVTALHLDGQLGDPRKARPSHSRVDWDAQLRTLRGQRPAAAPKWRRWLGLLNPISFVSSK